MGPIDRQTYRVDSDQNNTEHIAEREREREPRITFQNYSKGLNYRGKERRIIFLEIIRNKPHPLSKEKSWNVNFGKMTSFEN